MKLTQLVEKVWRSKFGRVLAAATFVAASSMSCYSAQETEGKQKTEEEDKTEKIQNKTEKIQKTEEKDTYPPCINFEMGSFDDCGEDPMLFISVHDCYCEVDEAKNRVKISKNLIRRMDEKHEKPRREVCSDLDRIELYENGKLVDTVRPEKDVSKYLKYDVNHKEGEFNYHVIAYDKAGNKAESKPINLVFKDGFYFKRELLDGDKKAPEIEFKEWKELEHLRINVTDEGSGISQIRLYEDGKLSRTEKPELDHLRVHCIIVNKETGNSKGYSDSMGISPNDLKGTHTLRVEAEDFAGNIKSEEKRFDFK